MPPPTAAFPEALKQLLRMFSDLKGQKCQCWFPLFPTASQSAETLTLGCLPSTNGNHFVHLTLLKHVWKRRIAVSLGCLFSCRQIKDGGTIPTGKWVY